MHGLPTIGTIGFGWFEVSGRRRVPSPPAMTTAFMRTPRSRALRPYNRSEASGEREAGPEDLARPLRRGVRDGRQPIAEEEQPGRGLAEEVDLEAVAAARASSA